MLRKRGTDPMRETLSPLRPERGAAGRFPTPITDLQAPPSPDGGAFPLYRHSPFGENHDARAEHRSLRCRGAPAPALRRRTR
jgi:hypothetical protein